MKLSDQKLYELCEHYGKMARLYRQKFIGLLPEVNRRRLYKRKGFSSIFEFAAKLAGLSQDQVRIVLRLDERFVNMPDLKTALEKGEVSVNKLTRIASIATAENQSDLSERVKILPKAALDIFVKEIKSKRPNGLFEPQNELKSLPVQNFFEENFSEELKQKLFELKEKGEDINSILLEFLKSRELKIAGKNRQSAQTTVSKPASRHIPAKFKKIIHQKHGSKCSVPNCQNPAEIIHHTLPFAIAGLHDSRFLAPLCKGHHAIAHLNNVRFAEMSRR